MSLPHSNFFFTKLLDELSNIQDHNFFEKKLYASKDLNTLYSYLSLSIALKSFQLSDNKFRQKAGSKVLKYFYSDKKERAFNRRERDILSNSILLCMFDSLIAGTTGANPHLISGRLKEPFKSPFKNKKDMLTIAQGSIYFYQHMGVRWEDSEMENIFNCLEESYNSLIMRISPSEMNVNDLRLYLFDQLIHSYNTEKYNVSEISSVLHQSLCSGKHVFSNPLTSSAMSCSQVFLLKLKELN